MGHDRRTVRSVSSRIRVVIVDDSVVCRESVREILEVSGDIQVVGEAVDAFSAVAIVEALAPDVVTMDVQMPGKSGLEAVEQIMSRRPVPILVLTAQPLSDESGIAFAAVESGALEVFSKPSIDDDAAGEELRDVIRRLSRTPVFQRLVESDSGNDTQAPPSGTSATAMVAIAAGAGAMSSVLSLLAQLAELRCPIILSEPVVREQSASYANHIGGVSRQRVRRAEARSLTCGPSDLLLDFEGCLTCTAKGELSLDVDDGRDPARLLRSIAEVYGPAALVVVLDGKGTEGLDALPAVRAAGAEVLIQAPRSGAPNERLSVAIASCPSGRVASIQTIAAEISAVATSASRDR